MLYLLFVLTFLAGILFYGMSPRDDKLQMDVHQAEGMILSFVSQHQAAKDYVYTWLGVGPVGSNVLANGFLHPNFENMVWGKGNDGIKPEVCDGNNGVPGFNSCQNEEAKQIPGFVSRVICVNKCVDTAAAAAAASPCGLNDEQVVDCDNVVVPAGRSRRSYVITYGGWQNCNGGTCTRPDWWPTQGQRMRKFESWRKAISKRTRNSASCGFLFSTDDDHPTDSTWCIDNGETAYERDDVCQNPVPPSLIGQLREAYGLPSQHYGYLYDLLFCYSGFKQGIPGHYASGVRYFYDGISNAGPGQHTTGGNWQNLAGNETMTTTLTDHPYIERDSELDTEIVLGASYTLTIILTYTMDGGAPGNNNVGAVFDIFRIPEEASDTEPQKIAKRIFQKTNAHEQFQTNFSDGTNFLADACNGATKTGEGDARGIISWTFVVNGQKMKVYENATLTPFGTDNVTTIVNTNGKQLMIGPATEGNAHIYGIRYYPGAELTQEEIAQNFKADQKRFGIPDRNNGKQIGHPDIDGGTIYCSGACASDLRGNGWQNDPRMDGRPVDEGGCGVAGP